MIARIGRALTPYLFVLAQMRRESLYALVAREARRSARR